MEVEVPRQGVALDPSVRRTAPGFVKLNSGFRSAGCSLATFVRDSGAQFRVQVFTGRNLRFCSGAVG